jgi:hypothetical protein
MRLIEGIGVLAAIGALIAAFTCAGMPTNLRGLAEIAIAKDDLKPRR